MTQTTVLNPQWARVINTTIRDYMKGEQVNILRKRTLSALMQKRGRISFGHSGSAMDWKVRYRRAPMVGFAEGDSVTFSRQERHKTASLDWRGYSAVDSMFKMEFLANRGPEAIIKTFDSRAKLLLEDVTDRFGEEWYTDGTLAANLKSIYGVESYMGATQVVGNGAMAPTASYAGISCVPGYYGGSWTGPSGGGALTWPNGKGEANYDFWSPLVVDVGDTYFSGTSTWAANCVAAVAYAIIKTQKMPAKDGGIDVFLLNDQAYEKYISSLRSSQRIVISGKAPELVGLGFQDTVEQDGGKPVTWEYGLPSSAQTANGVGVIGYGLNVDQLELCSMQDQIFVPDGPDYDPAAKTWRWSIDFFGNLRSNPKYQCKFYNATTTTDPSQS